MAGYLVILAARLGVPAVVITRMILNTGLDMLIGAIPLAGDLFDIGWRANSRNLALLERALVQPAQARRASVAVIGGALAALAGLAIAGVAGTIALIRWIL